MLPASCCSHCAGLQPTTRDAASADRLPLQVDPFDAQEARPYKQDPEVLAMTNLVAAYQGNNIREFEKILATNRRAAAAWRSAA